MNVLVGRIYRHYKGNYYLVDYDCSNVNTKVFWNKENYTLTVGAGALIEDLNKVEEDNVSNGENIFEKQALNQRPVIEIYINIEIHEKKSRKYFAISKRYTIFD